MIIVIITIVHSVLITVIIITLDHTELSRSMDIIDNAVLITVIIAHTVLITLTFDHMLLINILIFLSDQITLKLFYEYVCKLQCLSFTFYVDKNNSDKNYDEDQTCDGHNITS